MLFKHPGVRCEVRHDCDFGPSEVETGDEEDLEGCQVDNVVGGGNLTACDREKGRCHGAHGAESTSLEGDDASSVRGRRLSEDANWGKACIVDFDGVLPVHDGLNDAISGLFGPTSLDVDALEGID